VADNMSDTRSLPQIPQKLTYVSFCFWDVCRF